MISRLFMSAICLALLGSFILPPVPSKAAVQSKDTLSAEPYSGDALCLPDAYPAAPADCIPLGPSILLADLAKQGLTYPPIPLPASKPSSDLTQIPVAVAKINLDESLPVDIYNSFDDAVAGTNATRQIAPGVTRYVSYIAEKRHNNKPFVQLPSGEWVRASPSGYPLFQGLAFRRTPTTMFGWMLDMVVPYTGPGYNYPQKGDQLAKWSVILIENIQKVGDQEWYQIGADQWVPWLKARRVRVNTTPPKDVTNGRWIEVNLYDQTLSVYDNRQLVFATLVATGAEPLYTRPGLFPIKEKYEVYTMTGAFNADRSDYYYLEDVPWTMFFDEGRALHGAYWRAWFGYPGTHGCVNLSIGDSAWLFQWANVGDWVYVWDPSGETPVDPSLYGPGGA